MNQRFWPFVLVVLLSGHPFTRVAVRAGAESLTSPSQSVIELQQRGPVTAAPGQPIAIEIEVRNAGALPAHEVEVTDQLPAGCTVLGVSPAARQDSGTVIWSLGCLKPNEPVMLRLSLILKAGADAAALRNMATAVFRSEIRSSFVVGLGRPALSVVVTGPEFCTIGGPVTLSINITNHSGHTVPAVVLRTILPPGLYHPMGADLENELGNLEAGKTRVVSLQVTPQQSGALRSQVRVQAPGVESVGCEAQLRAGTVRLAIAANGPQVCYLHWPCTYDFTVKNEGNQETGPVHLVVQLPQGIAYDRSNAAGQYDAAMHAVWWTLPALRPGQNSTVLLTVTPECSGLQEGRLALQSDQTRTRQLTWSTRVLPEPAADAFHPAAPE
jgi:uncharacterized repeat protein (TIGR01451 family)